MEEIQTLEKPGTKSSKDWKPSLRVLIAVVAVMAALPYFFGCRNEFVYDDHGSVAENPFLHERGAWLKTLTLQTFFDPTILDGQRPVVILSYLADLSVWSSEKVIRGNTLVNFSPFGFHLTNILLHAGSAVLLFLLLTQLAAPPALRLTAAILFGLHPAISEAVQVPAFREDLLATFFSLAFLLLAARKNFYAAFATLFLALLSKETAIVAPALLVWLWLCFPTVQPSRKTAVAITAGGVALVAVYLLVTFTHRPLQAAGEVWNGLALRWPDTLSTSPWIYLRELKTLLVPYPLCADYVVKPVGFADPQFFAGIVALAATAFAALYLRRKSPLVALGFGLLLINYAPISNLIPLFNPMADRYLYFPAVGFALLLGAGIAKSPQRMAIFAVVSSLYFGLTANRVRDWKTDEILWRATVKAEPRSARAQTWLGLLAAEKKDYAEAAMRYQLADELNPHNVHALVNLAVLEGQAGYMQSAEKRLREATTRRPDFADGWWNLAMLFHMTGREVEAAEAAKRAAAINPHDPRVQAFARRPQT